MLPRHFSCSLRLGLLLFVTTSWASAAPATEPSLPDARAAVTKYVEGGAYFARIAVVAKSASKHLARRARAVHKPALVVDIDETALTNLVALRLSNWNFDRSGTCDIVDGPCDLYAWIELAGGEAIQPVLALVRRAKASGVAVFFITNRPERLREVTVANLAGEGYEWEELFMRQPGDKRGSSEYKTAVRKLLVRERNNTIIVNIGDQHTDLSGGFSERSFKLPNPFYRSK